jgi:hypothetical protein
MDARSAKDLKPGMPPGFQQSNMIGSDLTFGEKPGKDFGSKWGPGLACGFVSEGAPFEPVHLWPGCQLIDWFDVLHLVDGPRCGYSSRLVALKDKQQIVPRAHYFHIVPDVAAAWAGHSQSSR